MNADASNRYKNPCPLFAFIISWCLLVNGHAQEVLNNGSIIELQKIGLGESIIVQKIKSSTCNFDTTISGLKQLKAESVSDNVIQAMVAASSSPMPNTAVEPGRITNAPSKKDIENASSQPSPSSISASNRLCLVNYSEEGRSLTGKTYKTYQDFSGLDKGIIFDRLVAKLAADGWHIGTANKDVGIISASTSVVAGEGKTVPFNVVVSDVGSGMIRVQLTFHTGFGEVASRKSIQKDFCNVLDSVSH